MRQRVAVLVSGGGTNLQTLIDAEREGRMPHAHLCLVLASRAGVFALERAKQAGIPTQVVPRTGQTREAFEARCVQYLEEAGIDMLVLAGFLTVLSAAFVQRYAKRILNVHPSLLPSFGGVGFYGLRVHEAALARGVKLTGATVHFVDEVCDGGEIVLQKSVAVLPHDTPQTLQQRVMEQAEWVLLPQALEQVCAQRSELAL